MEWIIEDLLAQWHRPGWDCCDEAVPRAVVEAWIDRLKAAGIRGILCLLHGEELAGYYPGLDLLACYRKHGFIVAHVPAHDYQNPPLEPRQLAGVAAAWQRLPKPVLVHCSAGIARSGQAVRHIVKMLNPPPPRQAAPRA